MKRAARARPNSSRLRQREDLLELVEDQQRDEGAPAGVAQHVVAMVQELPERLACMATPAWVHSPGGARSRRSPA